MAEQFSNGAQTTIVGALTTATTAFVLTSATGFPTTPNFRCLISAEGANSNEIVTIISISGASCTATRASEAYGGSSSASAHGAGATITHVFTAGSLVAAFPLGTIGYAQVTADQGSITTVVDLTGLSVTVSVASGHRIKVSGYGHMLSTVAGDEGGLLIREGSTQLNIAANNMATASYTLMRPEVILTPTAGSHTYKLSGQRNTGTGTLTFHAGSTLPGFILVEDIGL